MKIHFCGIGGISMSALARISLEMGYQVQGSDSQTSERVSDLENRGATIYIGQRAENVDPSTDLLVYTAAVSPDNPERKQAASLGIAQQSRAAFLGHLMEHYEKSVAIAGTHGKTSTTSMTSVLFCRANTDPTLLVGGLLPEIGGNVRIGHSPYFITEACEYTDSFLHFKPLIGVLLNIDTDHLDYFRDLSHIQDSFRRFAENTQEGGKIIANGDDPNVREALRGLGRDVLWFGFSKDCDCRLQPSPGGAFQLSYQGRTLGPYTLSVPGVHNQMNAAAALCIGLSLGLSEPQLQAGISAYQGVGRRFEYKGSCNGAKIYDDYAHHPTELASTLRAAASLGAKNLYVVFQPHTYSRTKSFFQAFTESFQGCTEVIFTDIYAAREPNDPSVNSKMLAQGLQKRGQKALCILELEQAALYLLKKIGPGDVVFTIGAGDVYKVGETLLSLSAEQGGQIA